METYKIVTQGQVNNGHTKLSVTKKLLSIRVSQEFVETILSGKKITLKKKLSWGQAKKVCEHFQQTGLKIELVLELNPSAFRLGLLNIDTNKTPNIDISSTAQQSQFKSDHSTDRWIFQRNQLDAKIFATTGSAPIVIDKQNNKNTVLTAFSPYWNPVFLFAITLIITASLQPYLVRLMVMYFSWSSLATVIGIICLVTLPLTLARLVQARSAFSIHSTENNIDEINTQLHLVEFPQYHIGRKEYFIYGDEGQLEAKIKRSTSKATLYSTTDIVIYQWDKNSDIVSEQESAASNISDVYSGDTLWGELLDNIGLLRTIKQLIPRKPGLKGMQFNPKQGSAICDEKGELVAIVYLQPRPALEFIHSGLPLIEQYKIALFSLTLISSAWL